VRSGENKKRCFWQSLVHNYERKKEGGKSHGRDY
jgi:hypothetical protein